MRQVLSDKKTKQLRKSTGLPIVKVMVRGGNITTEIVDLCGKCWETRLIPWLMSQGCTMRTKERDW
jgi:hypothetical protein